MYSYEDRTRAVKLYIKLGKRLRATIRQLGYPTKNSLLGWYRDYMQKGDLRAGYRRTTQKYSAEQKQVAVQHFLDHDRCMASTLRALGKALAGHQAGDAIDSDAHDLFRRETDRFIKSTVGKQPLDVGADRIARTAHAALGLLGELRRRLGYVIPLAWTRTLTDPVSAIEVYPAATLVGKGYRSSGYKNAEQAPQRREIIAALHSDGLQLPDLPVLEQSADALDAALCLVAAHDFLLRRAMPPPNLDLAKREGWIWARHHSERKQPHV